MPRPESELNMMFLAALNGGIVFNADIARRLAQLILEHFVGLGKLAANLPLRVEDGGDSWRITGSQPESSKNGVCRIEIRKCDAAVLALGVDQVHNVLEDSTLAEKFAEVMLESVDNEKDSNQQLPLNITGNGETWLARGRRNSDRAVEGPGPFELEFQKRDARVLDMGFEWVLKTPSDAQALLQTSGGMAPEHR
jgi:hypothetical protein